MQSAAEGKIKIELYFYLDFQKNRVGSPENQKINKFWPHVIYFTS